MQIIQPEQVGLSSTRLQRINAAMQKYIDQQQFAGVVTLVARRGRVAHLEACGWQNIESKTPMALDSIFRIYSMTKPIVSAAAMMLCEEAKLRLLDPLSRYLPDMKNPRVLVRRKGGYDLVPAKREITIHDLLTHSGGIYEGNDIPYLGKLYGRVFDQMMSVDDEAWKLDKVWPFFAKARLPLAAQPGTEFRYGPSIEILGYVVELVSGQSLDEFLRERIFAPLGMSDTAFWVSPEKRQRLAEVYGPAEAGNGLAPVKIDPRPINHLEPGGYLSGGGGLVSTIGDYFRFGQMMLNKGELDGVRLLGRQTVEWMTQNHLPPGVHPMDDPGNGFGLGGAVLINPGLSQRPGSVGKFGWGGMANTEWWIDPAEGLNCILMTQYLPGFTIPLVEDFAQTVYQALE